MSFGMPVMPTQILKELWGEKLFAEALIPAITLYGPSPSSDVIMAVVILRLHEENNKLRSDLRAAGVLP